MSRTCENCLYQRESISNVSHCGGGFCKHYTPLSLELSDDDIHTMVEHGRKEYYDAWLEYTSEDDTNFF